MADMGLDGSIGSENVDMDSNDTGTTANKNGGLFVFLGFVGLNELGKT
jgi:hypothetical protein